MRLKRGSVAFAMLCAQLTLCSGATVPRAASLSTRSPTTAATRLQRQGVVARGANTTGGPASGSGDVLALGGGTAWAYDGTDILRSTDLGASWQVVFPTWPQKPTALQVTGAFFLTSKDAWALTDHQWPAPPGVTTVWQTTDGGATWLKGLSMPDVERSDYGSPLQQFISSPPRSRLSQGGWCWIAPDGTICLPSRTMADGDLWFHVGVGVHAGGGRPTFSEWRLADWGATGGQFPVK